MSSETTFQAVEGGAVVYHRGAQRLFALSDAAAFVWLSLRDGISRDAIVRDVAGNFGLNEPNAEDWVERTIRDFNAIDRVAVTPPAERPRKDTVEAATTGVDYQLLGQTLRIDADKETLEPIDALLGEMRCPALGTPDAAIEIIDDGGLCEIHFQRKVFAIAARDRIAPEIERFVFEEMVPQVQHFLAFHSALMRLGDVGVLLAASSGSGKTTLSALLASRGWEYHSDEMALIDRELNWHGVPLPPCIKSENYSRIEQWYPDLRHVPEHVRHGRKVKYLPIPAEGATINVATVIFPCRSKTEAPGLKPIEPLQALTRLLSLCVYVPFGFTESDVTRLLSWHEGTRYFDLIVDDALESAKTLEGLCTPARR
jgi:hypothetical protein